MKKDLSVQSQVNEISPVERQLSVEIPWDRVNDDLSKSFKNLARYAQVKGFRKGKAPLNIVRKVYGPRVKADVMTQLIEEGMRAAAEEHQLFIVAQSDIDPQEITDGEPFRFTAKVEVRPTVDKVNTEGIEVWLGEFDVTDKHLDEEIEELRYQHADLITPEPMRPAAAGDRLLVDYTVEIDGELKDDYAGSDREIVLGRGRALKAIEEGLVGATIEMEKTIEVTFEDDHPDEMLRGKSANFQVTVKSIQQYNLPELDDEFAKDCGQDTLAALRDDIRTRMEETANVSKERYLKDQIIDELVRVNDVPVPPTMLAEQKQQMLYQQFMMAQMIGQQPNVSDLDWEGIEHRAARRVQAGILLSALARQEGIEVAEDDIEEKLGEIAKESGKHIAKLRAEYRGEKREHLEAELMETKLTDLLFEKAKKNEGERPQADAV